MRRLCTRLWPAAPRCCPCAAVWRAATAGPGATRPAAQKASRLAPGALGVMGLGAAAAGAGQGARLAPLDPLRHHERHCLLPPITPAGPPHTSACLSQQPTPACRPWATPPRCLARLWPPAPPAAPAGSHAWCAACRLAAAAAASSWPRSTCTGAAAMTWCRRSGWAGGHPSASGPRVGGGWPKQQAGRRRPAQGRGTLRRLWRCGPSRGADGRADVGLLLWGWARRPGSLLKRRVKCHEEYATQLEMRCEGKVAAAGWLPLGWLLLLGAGGARAPGRAALPLPLLADQ